MFLSIKLIKLLMIEKRLLNMVWLWRVFDDPMRPHTRVVCAHKQPVGTVVNFDTAPARLSVLFKKISRRNIMTEQQQCYVWLFGIAGILTHDVNQ